ncbi:glycosyltransferase family 2 protein [uncultured Bacteroides sp.]|uniref:glycosyltransferase family 2 protein n=1 Tax=uncultured Bacteroides sp. TaxID=162156 RepID=UPI00259AAE65|nr:glycosyltransferase family 2 protein [uncultured Bacteroides sp.]
MNNNSKPLFSFLLITYNQEKYITDAFNSLINQTYRNYEIIISDDNSKDNTFEICKELTEKYNGDIRIILHRNIINKGIGGNFQQAYELSVNFQNWRID